MEPTERSKKRVHPWINARVHFLLCFAVGALVAVAPLAATGASSATTIRSSFLGPFIDAHRAVAAPSPSPPAAPDIGLLLIVTVTRPDDGGMAQDASVARLAHTLRHVAPPLLWIVVGARNRTATARTERLLRGTGLMFRHLTYDATNFTGADAGDEADHQRNVALSHIELHRLNGIVHFAGASSVYDLRFFQTLRQTRGISAWPLATISPADQRVTLEGPTCNSSQITGWYSKDSSTNRTQIIANSMGAADTSANKNSSSDHRIINTSGVGFRSSLLWNSERSLIRRRNSSVGATQDFIQFVREIVILDGNKLKGVPSECFESQVMLWHMDMSTFTLNTEEDKEIEQQQIPKEEKKIEQQQNSEEEKEIKQQQNPKEEKETEQQQNSEKEKEIEQQQNPEEEKEIEQQQNLMKSDEDPTT
ncbi:probable glucuronosyltransferase Os01g0157700 [Sorghum bicolor]|nr:probable glucuronosyltransferase Os01g0157700 [Sorghum bicolor]|eukprot:XP_002457311.1 probable glucuronosyltransferase Os01g0157700 [Sorghum bicolor]